MDFNLLLSAQPLVLAANLRTTAPVDGLMVVKNVPAKTYLRVSPAQWEILRLFEEPQMVPAVLDRAIRSRMTPPLGEFYELILKAERACVLRRPDCTETPIATCDWRGSVNPRHLAWPLGVLLLVGVVLSLGFRPELPSSILGAILGLLILGAASSLAEYLRGCLVRGAGGELYQPRWLWRALPPRFDIDTSDAVMMPRKCQDTVLLAEPAVLAAAAGITTWNQPEWCFFPLLGLIYVLRPILGGRFPEVIRLGREQELSDAEHSFLFPPNRTPRLRWRALARGLRQTNTWVRFCYGVIWTLAVVYLAARLTDTPPWSTAFWEAHGTRIAIAIAGSLLLLGLAYLAWETIQFAGTRGNAWRHAFAQWRARWFGGGGRELDEAARLEAIGGAPLLRALDPEQRVQLARSMEVVRLGPWRQLSAFEGAATPRVALVVRGRVAVRREDAKGRKQLLQILGPGDMLGLHDVADPSGGTHRLRTRTPVTLLSADRTQTSDYIMGRVTAAPFGNAVLKVPFLRGIALCRNWHLQAIQRFAQLSTLNPYPEGGIIFSEGEQVDSFYVVFEGSAIVWRGQKQVAVIRVGEFFGEIGLLQNSTATATITARQNMRCLAIPRTEFIRFVTNNYAVALELERVSSERLGRPIFPVRQSDFRAR